ncbi:unnamed protein product [Pedinophyceae sp. YPF-701]|nr:unnamed protein product [Pedinophyceae sp. YPF-701]
MPVQEPVRSQRPGLLSAALSAERISADELANETDPYVIKSSRSPAQANAARVPEQRPPADEFGDAACRAHVAASTASTAPGLRTRASAAAMRAPCTPDRRESATRSKGEQAPGPSPPVTVCTPGTAAPGAWQVHSEAPRSILAKHHRHLYGLRSSVGFPTATSATRTSEEGSNRTACNDSQRGLTRASAPGLWRDKRIADVPSPVQLTQRAWHGPSTRQRARSRSFGPLRAFLKALGIAPNDSAGPRSARTGTLHSLRSAAGAGPQGAWLNQEALMAAQRRSVK